MQPSIAALVLKLRMGTRVRKLRFLLSGLASHVTTRKPSFRRLVRKWSLGSSTETDAGAHGEMRGAISRLKNKTAHP